MKRKYADSIHIPGTKVVEKATHSNEVDGIRRTLRGTATVRINYNLTYEFPHSLIQDEESQADFIEKRIARELEAVLETITD